MEFLGWFFCGMIIGVLIGGVIVIILFDLDRDIQ